MTLLKYSSKSQEICVILSRNSIFVMGCFLEIMQIKMTTFLQNAIFIWN